MSYFWSSKASPYHGLVNQGSTCYLNSVLQVLFMTEDFREAVQRHTDVTPHTECIDRDLADLFKELGKRTSYTYKITKTLGIEKVYKQQDAAEYLEKILQRTSPEAAQIFRGLLTHRTTCCVCRTDSPSDGPFWFLPLALVDDGGDYSVLDGIKNYFKVTELSGNNQMYCETCDDKSDATMGCVIKTHPEVLMLLLKRFEFDYRYMTYVKIDCMVDVPRILHIPENETYELYAAVDHYGDLRGGHYVATIKPQDGEQWYSFNDTQVTKCDYQRFQLDDLEKSSSAYLLFYRRKDADAADVQVPAPGGLPAASSQICEARDEVKTQDDDSQTADWIETLRPFLDPRCYWKPENEVVGAYPQTVCEDEEGRTKNVRQNMHKGQESWNEQAISQRFDEAGRSGRGAENEQRGTFGLSQPKARPGLHKDPMAETKKDTEGGMMNIIDKEPESRGALRQGNVKQNMYGDQQKRKTGRDEESVDDGNRSMRYGVSGRHKPPGKIQRREDNEERKSGRGAENEERSTFEGSQTNTRTGHHKDLMAGGNYAKQQEEMEQMKKDEEGGTMYAKEKQKSRGSSGKGGFGDSRQNMHGDQERGKTGQYEQSVNDGNQNKSKNDWRYHRETSGRSDGAGRSGKGAENFGRSPLDGSQPKTRTGHHEDLMAGGNDTKQQEEMEQTKTDEERGTMSVKEQELECRGSSIQGGFGDGRQNMYGNEVRGKTGRDKERADDGNRNKSNDVQKHYRETTLDGAGMSGRGAENEERSTFEGSQTNTRTGHHEDLMAGGNGTKQQEEMEQTKTDEERGTMYVKKPELERRGSSGKGGFGEGRQNMHGDQKRGKTGQYEQSVDDGNQNTSNDVQKHYRETTLDGAGRSGRGAENEERSTFEGSQTNTRTGHHEDLMAGGNGTKQQEEMEQRKTDEERGTMSVKEQELECRGSSIQGGFGDGRQNMHGDQKRGKTGQYEQSVDGGNQSMSNNVQRYNQKTSGRSDGAGWLGKGAENFGHSPLDGSQPKTRIGGHKDPMAGGNYAKQQEEMFTGVQRSSSKMKKDEERRVKDKELEWLEIRGSSRQGRFAHISQNTHEDQERGKTGQYEQSVDDGNQNKSNNVQRHNQETSGRSDGAGRSGRGAENVGHGHFEESQAKGRHKDPMTGENYTSRKGGLDNIGRRDANLSKSLEVKITEEETVGGVKTSSETTITTVEEVKKISRIKKWMNRNKRNVEPRPDTSSIMSEVEHLTLSDSPGGDDSDANGKKQNESRAQAVERKTTKGKRHKSPKRRIKTSTTKNPFGCLKIKDKKKRTKSVGCWGFLKKYKRNRGAVTSESD